jgi:hypothetical protein
MINKKECKLQPVRKLVLVLIVVVGAVLITACSKKEEEETLSTVLEQVFNVPDGELIELSQETIDTKDSDTTGVLSIMDSKFLNRIDEKYQTYFTETAYENFLKERVPYSYHLDAYDNKYTLKVDTIDFDHNKTNKTKYDFIIHLIYKSDKGEEKKLALQGSAQFSEAGKISYLNIISDLNKKLQE